MKIDFYILDTLNRQKAIIFACSLIEKMYAEGECIYIHTPTQEEATRIDTLLWIYRDDSFVPHALFDSSDPYPPPIQIGFLNQIPSLSHQTKLFNLTPQIPFFYQQFYHAIEIVFNDPLVQQLARERYKQYRNQGHELNTYKLNL